VTDGTPNFNLTFWGVSLRRKTLKTADDALGMETCCCKVAISPAKPEKVSAVRVPSGAI
jgi:hypothetical protein